MQLAASLRLAASLHDSPPLKTGDATCMTSASRDDKAQEVLFRSFRAQSDNEVLLCWRGLVDTTSWELIDDSGNPLPACA